MRLEMLLERLSVCVVCRSLSIREMCLLVDAGR